MKFKNNTLINTSLIKVLLHEQHDLKMLVTDAMMIITETENSNLTNATQSILLSTILSELLSA